MKGRRTYRLRVLALAAALTAAAVYPGIPAVYAADNKAAAMQLAKTEGTVDVINSSEKNVSKIDNVRLYNGYQVNTEEESYAWIELDRVKMAKLDAVSEVSIRKKGKKLEILLESGNIFFNVAEPLADDESLNIRTSTMVAGIRGTSGWVEVTDDKNVKISVLEGNVELSVSDPVTGESKKDTVAGGETAVCVVNQQTGEGGKCEIQRESFKMEEISGFVLKEVAADTALADKIFEKSSIDLRDLTEQVVEERLKQDEAAAHQKVEEVKVALETQAQRSNVSAEPIGVAAPSEPAVRPVAPSSTNNTQRPSGNISVPVNPGGTTTTPDPQPSVPDPKPETPDPQPSVPDPKPETPDPQPSVPDPKPETPDPQPLFYQVKFDSRGGSSLASQSVADGSMASEPERPTLAGYEFTGWYTDASCMEEYRYDFGRPVTGSFTLYAGWKAGENPDPAACQVKFDAQGGSEMASQSVPVGSMASEPATSPVREGYEFTGWYTDAACTAKYDFAATVTGDITLYAGWNAKSNPEPEVYQVTFDAQGGSETKGQSVQTGNAVSEPTQPIREGHEFTGWYTDASCTAKYDFAKAVTGNLMLYAGWNAKIYTVSFDANGGSSTPDNQKVSYDGTVSKPVPPTRDNYNFAGWYTDKGLYNFETKVTGNLTLYAIWEDKTHRVFFFFDDSTSANTLVEHGNKVSEPNKDNVTPRPGYKFTGWYTDASCAEGYEYDFNKEVTNELRLYAGWEIQSCTVRFVEIIDGAENDIETQEVSYGGQARVPSGVKNTQTSIFTGWYEASDNNTYNTQYDFTKPVIQNIKLYARWESVPDPRTLCKVTFNPNGGVLETGKEEATKDRNKIFGVLPTPLYQNSGSETKIFQGWYTEDKGGTRVKEDTLVSDIESMTLYAHWMTWSYDADELTITGTDAMADYSQAEEQPWNQVKDGIKSIKLGTGITRIGNFAFSGCGNLANVTLPNTVKKIGSFAFSGCRSLTSVTLPGTIEGIGQGAFDRCSSLTDIYFSGSMEEWEKFGVRFIGVNPTVHCSDGAKGNTWFFNAGTGTLTITGMEEMKDYYTGNVNDPPSEEKVAARPWEKYKKQIKSLVVKNEVTYIGRYAFAGYPLETVTIEGGVTSIGEWAFFYCAPMEELTIPASINRIGHYAFAGCDSITAINFGGTKEKWETLQSAEPFGKTVPSLKIMHFNSNGQN